MDWNETMLPFLKEHVIAIVFGAVGLICLSYGAISLLHPQQTIDPEFPPLEASSRTIKVTPVVKKITIDVEGAVQKPGVYQLPADSRTQDALVAAGGLSQNADHQEVAQNLNLASQLTDGAKLYIPTIGEQMVTSGSASTSSSGNVAGASTGKVNINQASESELDALPGIGPVTAQKIISNRPYQSVQDVIDKKAVGQSVFSKIKDLVSVY